MIRIIDGKRYNTKTATMVAGDSFGYAGDFREYCEVLYRTEKGVWFLHGQGGPMTRWGQGDVAQEGRCGGEGIEVMTDDEARAWLEHNDEIEALDQYFEDQIEDA